MAQAAPQDKEILGHSGERRSHTNQCRYYSYRLVTIVQHDIKLKRSPYEVLQILSISLTDKTHLRDLFNKINFNNVKDLDDPLIPEPFD